MNNSCNGSEVIWVLLLFSAQSSIRHVPSKVIFWWLSWFMHLVVRVIGLKTVKTEMSPFKTNKTLCYLYIKTEHLNAFPCTGWWIPPSFSNLSVLSLACDTFKMVCTCINTFLARASPIRIFIIYSQLITDLIYLCSSAFVNSLKCNFHFQIALINKSQHEAFH